MKNKNNNFGFTLVEMLLAAGMASIVGLIAYSTLKTSTEVGTKTQIGSEVAFLKNMVISNMSDPIACENTFGNETVSLNEAVVLKDKYDKDILKANDSFGATATKSLLRITKIKSVATTNSKNGLLVSVEYDISATAKTNSTKTKGAFDVNIFINRTTDETKIANCMVDTAQLLKDAVRASCQMNEDSGAVFYVPPAFPAVPGDLFPYGKCIHKVNVVVNGVTNEVLAGTPQVCPDGEFLTSVVTPTSADPINKGMTRYQCRKLTLDTTCPAGSYLNTISSTGGSGCVPFVDTLPTSINPGQALMATSGGYIGVSLSCTNANEAIRYIDASGVHCTPQVITQTCPAGYFVSDVNAAGTVSCARSPQGTACGANQYVKSVNADGAVTCAPVTLPGACPAGQAIRSIDSSGNITSCAS